MQLLRPLRAGPPAGPVSILYEANEVCNLSDASQSILSSPFQSSTRLTRFATGGVLPPPLVYPLVSILYEANEVCNVRRGVSRYALALVSILYEANEVCNALRRP